MNLNDAIDIIESHEFSARLNAASNFNTVLKIAQKQEAVKALSNYLDDSINREKIFARIVELSKKKSDLRYENPWDIALSMYLWILSLKDFDLAYSAAEIIEQIPQSWWSVKVAQHLLLAERQHDLKSAEAVEV